MSWMVSFILLNSLLYIYICACKNSLLMISLIILSSIINNIPNIEILGVIIHFNPTIFFVRCYTVKIHYKDTSFKMCIEENYKFKK